MSYFVMYDKSTWNRYLCDIYVGRVRVECIIDTASSNTLVPLKFAEDYGKKLNHSAKVIVAGNTYEATLYLFENTLFGNLKIEKLVAFAANYKGNIENRMLLGLNVINNLEITFSRHKDKLYFNYKPYHLVKNKKYPCAMFFKTQGSEPVYPTELLVDIATF
ncbi:MAG: retropepsin-like domain-containing protein [Defluviitaleaceae bacterium]|nr:retropepsin-like domain-containing protein [Defluviitaleaceae bacterium]